MQVTEDETLPLKVAFMAEIDEVAYRHSRHAQVVKKLGFMLRRQFRDGFEFHDDAAEDEQVGLVAGRELVAFVIDFQLLLGQERDSPKGKLDFEALLVDFPAIP